jgi:hypothetical protein
MDPDQNEKQDPDAIKTMWIRTKSAAADWQVKNYDPRRTMKGD